MEFSTVCLPAQAPGVSLSLQIYRFGPPSAVRSAYIQAGLHADELPGVLVSCHLIRRLQQLEQQGKLTGRVVIVPYANPIGLSQKVFGPVAGRFNLENGENFNRNFPDLTPQLEAYLARHGVPAHASDARQLLLGFAADVAAEGPNAVLKKTLLLNALEHDVVLDLHCDTDSVLHLYGTNNCRDQTMALARELGASTVLLEDAAGGMTFDQAYSRPWQVLQQGGIGRWGCSISVELRGQADVDDDLAEGDAEGILRYLAGEGIVALPERESSHRPQAFPLEGASHLSCRSTGLIVFYKRPGDAVALGEPVAAIVPVDGGPDVTREIVRSDVNGILLARQHIKLARSGQRIAMVAGAAPLAHRQPGKLMDHF
jgi:predicted deacylase